VLKSLQAVSRIIFLFPRNFFTKERSNKKTLASLCLVSSNKYKNRPALAMFNGGKIIGQITYEQMGIRVRQIGSLLRQFGAEGGKVLLLSENRPEWVLFYFGIACAQAVSVPLLTGFSGEQIENIASHADVCAVCLSRSMADKFDITAFVRIPFFYIDTITDNETGSEITVSVNGRENQTQLCPADGTFIPQTEEDDLAAIIYTSGTQGNSKGVMLSGRNIMSSAVFALSFFRLKPSDRLLSVLPLAHSLECCVGLVAPLIRGAFITYLDRPPSPSALIPAAKTLRPTIILSVPLLIEKIYNGIIAPKLNESKLYKFPVTRPFAVKAAGRELNRALGGRLRLFGIGGSSLAPETEKFLRAAGFPYSTGYGLTEAAPLVTGNKAGRFPFRCAGTPPKGVSVRIADNGNGEGEIQVKVPNITRGYYKDESCTREAFTPDGCLRTGDIGRLGKKGGLYVNGRIKALILGPSGENIYPEEIESLLGASELVADALVLSGEKGEIVALVNLSETAKAAAGAAENALEDLRRWANKKLAVFSRVNRIEIKKEPFEKTPTMKIKRYLYV